MPAQQRLCCRGFLRDRFRHLVCRPAPAFSGKFPSSSMKALQNKLIVLGGLLLILPRIFSRKYRVVRRALIRARPQQIFPLINDLRNWPRWTAWSKREKMHLSYEGEPAGVGAIQNWKTSSMEGTLRIVQSQPDSRIAYDLSMCDGK